MRRTLVAGLVGLTVVAGALAPAAAAGSGTGTYLTPFREDGAAFVNGSFQNGTYQGQPTDNFGCVEGPTPNAPQGNPLAYRCMPAGASVILMPNGQILYWDALEGTENIPGLDPSSTILTDGGRLTVNDESRLLTLDAAGNPTWSVPGNPDGGAHNTSTAQDLPLPAPLAATHYPYNNGSMFCSDQVILGDGSVLDVGGTDYYTEPTIPGTNKGVVELEGVRNTRQFQPNRNSDGTEAPGGTWVETAPMNFGRWYPGLVTLGNGNVFVASGVTKLLKPIYPTHPLDSGTNVEETETYDPALNVWTENGQSANRSLPLFPRLHLLPNGNVYYDAAGQDFNPMGQSYDEALWNLAGTYDPSTKSWTDLGIPGLLQPGVNPLYAGFRASTFSAALQLRPDANGDYTQASFLTAGGVLLPSPGSVVSVNNTRIDTVTTDAAGNNEKLTTVQGGDLPQSRWYTSAVPLPDGTVYAVNGADIDEVIAPGLESPIQQAEIFTPTISADGTYTGGSWMPAGTTSRKRTYHNTAMLLPDGSVLIGGNAPIPFLYTGVMDGPNLPGRPGTDNHHDASFQIYRPPYFNLPRPTLTGVAQAGDTLVVGTPDAATIASVVLIRNTAQTHLVDGDARTVQLPILSRDPQGGTVTVKMPASTDVLPNGPYLLFVNQNTANPGDAAPGQVVPSIGQQVFVTGTATPALLASGAPPAVRAAAALTAAAAPATLAAAAQSAAQSAAAASAPTARPSNAARPSTAGPATVRPTTGPAAPRSSAAAPVADLRTVSLRTRGRPLMTGAVLLAGLLLLAVGTAPLIRRRRRVRS